MWVPACQAGVLGPGYLTHCLEQACRLQVGPTDPLHCGEGHSLQDGAGAQAGPQELAEVSVAGSTQRGSPEEQMGVSLSLSWCGRACHSSRPREGEAALRFKQKPHGLEHRPLRVRCILALAPKCVDHDPGKNQASLEEGHWLREDPGR